MNRTIRSRARRSGVVLVLSVACLVAALAGCSVRAALPVAQSSPLGGARIELAVGDRVVPATLADTPAARAFAALLPVTVDLRDRFGQAKAGELPHALTAEGTAPVVDPAPGGLYYWSPDRTIVVFTTDLGPSIPAPGLTRLGTVDRGLGALAAAGNRFRVTIRPVR